MPPAKDPPGFNKRGYVIQSPPQDNQPVDNEPVDLLVLDVASFGDDKYAILAKHPIHGHETPPKQRWRVDRGGHIENVQGGNGYLTRVQVDGVTKVKLKALGKPGEDEDQVWNFKAGPNPPPGGGPHGNDKYSIVVDKSLGAEVPLPEGAILLTAQGVNQQVVVQKKIENDQEFRNRQLWYFYWLPGH